MELTELQELLSIIRFETGFSDEKVAEKIKVSRETLNIAKNKGEHPDIMEKLRKQFRVEVSHFVSRFFNRLTADGILLPPANSVLVPDGENPNLFRLQSIADVAARKILGLDATVAEFQESIALLRAGEDKSLHIEGPKSKGNSQVDKTKKGGNGGTRRN